jgi:hypothetical protein
MTSRPEEVDVLMLGLIRSAFVANSRALKIKDRLTAIALRWLVLSVLLIGVLNLPVLR